MKRITGKIYNERWILLICLIAFYLRVKGLTYQSLWLDELHTMNEADPSLSWSDLFTYLKTSDQHPPLFFIIEKFAFIIFGHTSSVARFIPVIAGTISVWAMYRLGKELLNNNLGIICAVLTAVNFYNISYSQEARPYIFAFLFATLSFTFFIRLIKFPSVKTSVLYAVYTVLLLYSHYYSMFVMMAQLVTGVIFILLEKGSSRKDLFKRFLLSASIVAICYLPLFSFLKAMGQIKSFWIKDISPSFMQEYFYDYFGNAEILKPLLLFLLFAFFVRVSLQATAPGKNIKEEPVLFGFTIIICWVFVGMLIPYIRSLLVVPMLHPRYTIIVLPAMIIALAYGIEMFRITFLKYLVCALFVVLSFIHLFWVKKYYTEISKTQFREMTAYIVSENEPGFPIINERTAWHQQYYLMMYSSEGEIIPGNKEFLVDSILQAGRKEPPLEGFWIAGAHGETMLGDSLRRSLDTAYIMIREKIFFDAWAQLYISRSYKDGNFSIIDYKGFKDGEGSILEADKQVGVWSGTIHSKPFFLNKGNYRISITAMGTKAGNEYPHVKIFCNGKLTGDYFVTGKLEEKYFEFENASDSNIIFTVEMDNDLFLPSSKEDRNLFLKSIIIQPNSN